MTASAIIFAETSEGFANMAKGFTLLFIGAGIAYVAILIYGTWVSAIFLSRRFPETGLMKVRGIALLKQLLGYALWAYFGSASMKAFFIDTHQLKHRLHVFPLSIALYLVTFAMLSHMMPSPSPHSTSRVAVLWVVWDFATISLPLFLLARALHI